MSEDDAKPLPVSSSTPPQFAAEQRAMFSQVLRLFNAERIPFAVSGAFALHEHTGIWRDTKDLDLFLAEQDMPLAFAALESAGLTPKVYDPVWLSKAHRGDYFVDLITGMSNGVIRVHPDWIERAKVTDVLGVQAKVLAAEELIASKLFVTRRERFDGADIAHVIHGKAGEIDWPRILEILGEHWMMLLWALLFYQYIYPAQSRFVPRTLWDHLLGRLREELDCPAPHAVFRGTLIDEKMFAIDADEWGMADLNRQFRGRKAG